MLYLNYGKEDDEQWRSNVYGGNENLETVALLKDLNKAVFGNFPHALMIAEESTSWPLVTKPTDIGGLGFNFKWNMGWMNDSLHYMKHDPYYKSYGHNKMTFAMTYFTYENYILPLSHDEVVHMKGSLINKMPGSYEQKFANLRAYLTYMMAHPGKKLLFMGGELAQFSEWDYQKELDWQLLDFPMHRMFHQFIRALNNFYKENSELWELDDSWNGFEWLDPDDSNRNVLSFKRKNRKGGELIVISNFAAIGYNDYYLRLDPAEKYELLFSSADEEFGGFGHISPVIDNAMIVIPELSTSIWKKSQEV
jgi:1,4-alpha-glucan branching enzyme